MKKNLAFLLFLISYQLLFWREALGINLFIFSAAALLFVSKGKAMPASRLFILGCWLFSGLGVIIINSNVSILVLILCFSTYLGHLAYERASVWEAFSSGLLSFFSPRRGLLPQPLFARPMPAGVLYLRLAIFPLFLLLLYYLIFNAANPVFSRLNQHLFAHFSTWLNELSWSHLLFIGLGLLLLRWIFMPQRRQWVQLAADNRLQRQSGAAGKPPLALKHKYISALMVFVSLNLLFAVVNYIDVKWVWFQFNLSDGFSLKDFLHEGFYWLIGSLLLSIAVILFLFRGNLNFYPRQRTLRILAQAWIAQNLILAISVALRLAYYIQYHGLANGRLLVMVFLVLVFFGLLSLSYKIRRLRNNAFVWRVNSAFFLAVFALCALVNWDGLTARVNINHGYIHQIHVDHYLNLNPQVYPYLYDHLEKVEAQIKAHNQNRVRWIGYASGEDFKAALDARSARYLERRSELGPASWTLADQRATRQLKALVRP